MQILCKTPGVVSTPAYTIGPDEPRL